MAKSPARTFIVFLALSFACVRASYNAHAQFDFPYDPDFAEEPQSSESDLKPEEEPRLPLETRTDPVSGEIVETAPEWMRKAGPFLLIERPDAERIFSPEDTAASPDLSDFLKRQKPFEADQDLWNRMRRNIERGTAPQDELELPSVEPATPFEIVQGTAPPAPPEPEVELPTYGTSLSITGRKVIGFTFSEKRFLREQTTTGRPASQNLIDIDQQLQLRMQGKVGPKISVNVDYDDTKENKQDISVVYNGEPGEVVQNASFGDIDLSLPATEFVSYNKQLFGIRVDLKVKRFSATFIGSRTKGTTKTKQFKGNTQFITQDILDTAYIRRRYFDLSFGDPARLPLRAGSERIFLSRQSSGQQNVNELTLTAGDLSVPSSSFTGTFVELSAGQDYTIDYVDGIITFKNSLDPAYVVAVDFIDATGTNITVQTSTNSALPKTGDGQFKLIKTFGDVQISTSAESGYRRELKTFYGIGRSQIVRDDGRGNFFLKTLDQNRNEVGPTLNPRQVYPDTIEVDFENGIFRLTQPFAVEGDSATVDAEIYAPAPLTKRLFQVEFRFRLKTFFLEPNLVLQSEVVLIDGSRLTRNVDYFIDYESGFLTFFNEDRIREDSTIDVSYEVAPFAGNASESLLGMRVSYDIFSKWSVGSTLLFQTGSKPPTTPSVTELAESLLVYEVDSQLKDIPIFSWLRATFQGEMARSDHNPNLSKNALIENMEGVKQDDAASLQFTNWFIAANPTLGPADPAGALFSTFDENILTINPSAPANSDDTQKVLSFDYDFTKAGVNEVSIVYPFSPTGLDFSQKTILEVQFAHAPGTGGLDELDVNFHLGGISEDADGDGIFDTEDNGKDGVPDTLDLGERDGILQPEEDMGYLYNPAGKSSARFGANTGFIDSEDLNRNGRLDPADFSGDDYGYKSTGTNTQLFDATSGSTITFIGELDGATDVINDGKYHTLQIPLNISTANFTNFLAIKQLRITLRKRGGGTAADAGKIKIARIAAVGNTWQRGEAGDPAIGSGAKASESLIVSAVNNVDNTEYIGRTIFNSPGDAQGVFNELYGSLDELRNQGNTNNIQEQALELRYRNMGPGATVFTKRVFARAINISQHNDFVFLLFGNADQNPCTVATQDISGDRTFFLRAGSEKDFLEVRVPITFCGWKKIVISQNDTGGDQVADSWGVKGAPAGAIVVSSGSPNLQQIGAIFTGVYSSNTTRQTGSVYLNEIHLTNPIKRKGSAQKLQADFQVPGWMSFGGKYRFVDRNFHTPTTVVANQDHFQNTAYLNFTRISWMPLQFNGSYTKVTTPNTNAVGDRSNITSLLNSGTLRTWTGTGNGTLQIPNLPRVNLVYEHNLVDFPILSSRLDRRQNYRSTLNYGVPKRAFYLPQSVDLTYNYAVYEVRFRDDAARLLPNNFNTKEFGTGYSAKLPFAFWKGSMFTPSFSVQRVWENRTELPSIGNEISKSYQKSRTQNAGFTSNWYVAKWLKPSLNYNVNMIENNILNPSTFTLGALTRAFDVGQIKTINRTANGSINMTLTASEIIPKTKLFRSLSLTNGYQLQDGDVWNNVESELKTDSALWIRTPLRPASPFAERASLTLRDTLNSTQRWSPLEAYALQGRKSAFKTLSITNNFVKSVQRNETTGTPSKTISTTLPDLIASISQLERLTWSERWMKNFQINLKYAIRKTLNVATSLETNNTFGTDLRSIIREKFDTSLSFNLRTTKNADLRVDQITQTTNHKDATLQSTFDIRKFRFTPKVDYTTDVTESGAGKRSQDVTVLTPSLLVRTDLNLPRGLYLPGIKKTLAFTNRIIWTTTLSMQMRSSPVTIDDNSRTLNFNTNADYELAKNLRMTLNGAFSRLWHKHLKEQEFLSYQFGTTLTFQF
ncbi:MAG: hypothetical protein AUJ52_05285 [Elusimicrobia bacterium CG1_02_63_36]|nr:MAG: hypothetical protein AUJ52_05285 [Elusimicrobia bacterium CG1_02_63_36]PJB23150.1 MAG: hypothetical protein CO113_18915 [Elusimicrobia bacterium CG_4_9_14_3_um_filter_62_55]